MGRRAAMVVVWVVGVVVAVSASMAAVGVVGDRVTSRDVELGSPSGSGDGDRAADRGSTTATSALGDGAGSSRAADAPRPGVTDQSDSGMSAADGGSAGTAPGGAPAPSAAGTVPASGGGTTLPPSAPGGSPGAPADAVPDIPSPTVAPPVTDDEVYVTIGGTVAVRCTGDAISLLYATPASGFQVHGDPSTSGSSLDVRFEGVGGDTVEHEARVRASCVGGTPIEEIEER